MNYSIYIYLPLLFLLGCSPNTSIDYDLIITNVNIIDGTGAPIMTNQNVFIKHSQIHRHSINSDEKISGENVIDGTNRHH